MRAHDLRRRLWAAGPWALDALLALAATAAGVLILASVLPPAGGGPRTTAAYALVVAPSLWPSWYGPTRSATGPPC